MCRYRINFFQNTTKMSSVRWTAALLSMSPSCLACTSRIHSWCEILRLWTNNNILMSRAPADKLLITQPTRVPLSSKRVTYAIVATTTQLQSRQQKVMLYAGHRRNQTTWSVIWNRYSGASFLPSLASDAYLAQVQLGTNRAKMSFIPSTKQDQDTKIRPITSSTPSCRLRIYCMHFQSRQDEYYLALCEDKQAFSYLSIIKSKSKQLTKQEHLHTSTSFKSKRYNCITITAKQITLHFSLSIQQSRTQKDEIHCRFLRSCLYHHIHCICQFWHMQQLGPCLPKGYPLGKLPGRRLHLHPSKVQLGVPWL